MPRYFHVTSPKKARRILQSGFDHRNPLMGRDIGDPDRFSNDPSGWENWYAYYHLFFPALDAATAQELKVTLHDDTISEAERGRFMRDFWQDLHGDNWTLMWLGKDEAHFDYGTTILEFYPSGADIIDDDGVGYYYVLRLNRTIPASQFKLLGHVPESADLPPYEGIPYAEFAPYLEEGP